jgi:hypothetical protein
MCTPSCARTSSDWVLSSSQAPNANASGASIATSRIVCVRALVPPLLWVERSTVCTVGGGGVEFSQRSVPVP